MVDNINTAPAPETSAPAEAAPKTGFFSSGIGKVILIVAAVITVLSLLGAVAFFLLGGALLSKASKAITAEAVSTGTPPVSAVATSAVTEQAAPRQTEPVEDVFTFRNPFVPTVKAPASPTTTTTASPGTGSSGGSTDNSDGTSVPENTLALKSITTEDGELVATFIWNGATYTAREGDTLESTPWKVLNLTSSTAEMLYGDSEVTLSVGQGISK